MRYLKYSFVNKFKIYIIFWYFNCLQIHLCLLIFPFSSLLQFLLLLSFFFRVSSKCLSRRLEGIVTYCLRHCTLIWCLRSNSLSPRIEPGKKKLQLYMVLSRMPNSEQRKSVTVSVSLYAHNVVSTSVHNVGTMSHEL